MTTELSPRQREVLLALINKGRSSDAVVTAADRGRWRATVDATRVGRPCGCGTCPSVELVDLDGGERGSELSRVVLAGDVPGALVLLFVDDDLPSYLELAPLEDDVFEGLTGFEPATP